MHARNKRSYNYYRIIVYQLSSLILSHVRNIQETKILPIRIFCFWCCHYIHNDSDVKPLQYQHNVFNKYHRN